jgi:hypothetical protein
VVAGRLEILVLLSRALGRRSWVDAVVAHHVSPSPTSEEKPDPHLDVFFVVARLVPQHHSTVRIFLVLFPFSLSPLFSTLSITPSPLVSPSLPSHDSIDVCC